MILKFSKLTADLNSALKGYFPRIGSWVSKCCLPWLWLVRVVFSGNWTKFSKWQATPKSHSGCFLKVPLPRRGLKWIRRRLSIWTKRLAGLFIKVPTSIPGAGCAFWGLTAVPWLYHTTAPERKLLHTLIWLPCRSEVLYVKGFSSLWCAQPSNLRCTNGPVCQPKPIFSQAFCLLYCPAIWW